MSLLTVGHAIENKVLRYWGLATRVKNWPQYLFRKVTGFDTHFTFQLRNFGEVSVPRRMIGTFRECCFDDMYWRHIPSNVRASFKNPVVVDIGANVGYFVIETFVHNPDARVHCLEPHPYCFRKLQELQKELGERSFEAYQYAVGDADGVLRLRTRWVDSYTTKSTVLDDNQMSEEFEARCIRLDTFLEEAEIDKVSFLKIDCEGSEYALLYSLPDEIFGRITAIAVETHQGEGPGETCSALASFLGSKGYEVKVRDYGHLGFIWAWQTTS